MQLVCLLKWIKHQELRRAGRTIRASFMGCRGGQTMAALWRLIFSSVMLVVAGVLAFLAFSFYGENKVAGTLFGMLSLAGLLTAARGPKRSVSPQASRRRKTLIDFDDVDVDLYERAQSMSVKQIDGPPTKAQLQLAKQLGIELPSHVSASTAMSIIDEEIRF